MSIVSSLTKYWPQAAVAGAGIAGALSNTKSARTGTSTGTTMPIEPGGYSTLGDLLRSRAEARLRQSMDMTGYEANGIQNINSTFDPIAQSVNNSLTSRGLATSPVAASADATLGAARGGNIAQFLNTIPQVQRQMQNEDFAAASSLFSDRPLGASNTVVTTGAESPAAGGIGSAAEMLAFLNGQGLLGGAAKAGVGAIGSALGLGGAAASGLSALTGASTALAGGLIPGGATAAAFGGAFPAITLGGVGGSGLAAGAGGTTAAGVGGGIGMGATIGLTAGIGGALAAGAAILKSQAHWEANTGVKTFENPFHFDYLAPFVAEYNKAVASGTMTPQQAASTKQRFDQNWKDYQSRITQWAGSSSDKQKVARQSIANLQPLIQQISSGIRT